MSAAGLSARRPAVRRRRRPKLTVGLLNNMPDSALAATERQFGDLLRGAADGVDIELRCFALPGVRRGDRARGLMEGRYASAETLPRAGLDALVVTGNEPRAANLEDEPFWPALARVIDWTRERGVPTLWSCLAAHAAVLQLDGIRRQPLPAKLSGVFACQPTDGGEAVLTPHSRLNGLDVAALTAAGYRVLTRSDVAGVDAFAGPAGSLFLQGHPEYDADTLMREYVRDVGRFLRGERPAHPATPSGYFTPAVEAVLEELAERAILSPHPDLLTLYAEALAFAVPLRTWKTSAEQRYRGWLGQIAGVAASAVDAA
jgi:homoserine O-succinyltransferase